MLNIADRQPQGQTDLILTRSALPRLRRELMAEGSRTSHISRRGLGRRGILSLSKYRVNPEPST
jgi:hypothetical protein